MNPPSAMVSASATIARIAFGFQLAIALSESGKQLPPVPPFGLGPEADEEGWNRLYDLGVVHQLETWEQQGFRVHIEAGLPAAEEAAAAMSLKQYPDVKLEIERPEPVIFDEDELPYGPWPETIVDIRVDPDSLIARLAQFVYDHCAWSSQEMFGTTILIDFEDEDAVIDALTAFLWKYRHDPLPPGGGVVSEPPK